ncbi:MAG: PPC domain-containing protein, partial [Gaiellaceae bacterium]
MVWLVAFGERRLAHERRGHMHPGFRLPRPRVHQLLPILAGALLLGIAASGLAATPSSGTIDPTTTSASWQGQHYTAGANVANACPSSASDPANLVCDHFKLTVGVNSAYWNDKVGGALITITWASADNDFDLFVFDSQGNLVDDSAQGSTTFEQVMIPDAVGTYEVRVSPFLVANSGYSGAASFVSKPLTAAPGSG